MKRTLLYLLFLTGGAIFAQPISDDFSSYTLGNIGTDITGMTPGQNGWLTLSSNGTAPTTTTNASNDNFQIVDNGGTNGYVVQITGPNGNPGSSVMWQNGLGTWWAMRPPGNDIIEVEYDFYTGPPTASLNNMRVLLYDVLGTKILAGLSMVSSTKVISGVAYYDNSAAPGGAITNYLFTLGAVPVVLTPDTWVRIGMSFNKTTGQVRWRGPGFNGFVTGAAMGVDPDEANAVATAGGAANNVSAIGLFDNLLVKNTATDTLLGVDTITAASELAVYPNPVSDMLTIANRNNVNLKSVNITDLNGRTVKSISFDGVTEATVDVTDLSAGVYMITIADDNGKVTQKIVKE